MRVRVVGDSVAFGQYLEPGESAWPELIGAAVRAVCGETTRQALERFPADVQSDPADVTVLQWGHNDANKWATDNGLNRVARRAYAANLAEMIDRCRRFNTKPVLCTLTRTDKDPRYDYEVLEYSRTIGRVARTYKVTVADVREAVSRDDHLLADGVHLNAAGHEAYAACVKEALASIPMLGVAV